MNNWHQMTASKTMSTLTNTSPYITSSDSWVQLILEKCDKVILERSMTELTSHKPNYKLGQGSPLACRSGNLQLGFTFLSFLAWNYLNVFKGCNGRSSKNVSSIMSTMFSFDLAKYFYIFILEHKLFLEPQSFHRAPLSAHFLEQIMCYVLNL